MGSKEHDKIFHLVVKTLLDYRFACDHVKNVFQESRLIVNLADELTEKIELNHVKFNDNDMNILRYHLSKN